MRLDGVEIKVSFSRDQTLTALEALRLPSQPSPWQIYFCEDVNPGAAATPLLDLNVIMRARVRPDDDDDVTIKLRPCRSSQFTDRWLKDTKRLKVEADWAGDRRVLAASHTEKRNSIIPAVVAKQRPFTDLFTDQQLEFLADCAGATINLGTVTVLPAVTAVRWGKEVTVGRPELELRAERWTVADLDFSGAGRGDTAPGPGRRRSDAAAGPRRAGRAQLAMPGLLDNHHLRQAQRISARFLQEVDTRRWPVSLS